MVKRFEIDSGVCGVEYAEIDGGRYVHYDDYTALEARVAELEKDAARYRWLIGCGWTAITGSGEVHASIHIPSTPVHNWMDEDNIEHLIENAMSHHPDESEA